MVLCHFDSSHCDTRLKVDLVVSQVHTLPTLLVHNPFIVVPIEDVFVTHGTGVLKLKLTVINGRRETLVVGHNGKVG